MLTIGERIKRKRQERGLSLRAMAPLCGYADHSTLGRIEAGKIDPTQSKLAKIAEVLGVTPAYLMGWEDKPEDLGALAAQVLKDPALLQLVNNYIKLSEADQASVSALVSSLANKKD